MSLVGPNGAQDHLAAGHHGFVAWRRPPCAAQRRRRNPGGPHQLRCRPNEKTPAHESVRRAWALPERAAALPGDDRFENLLAWPTCTVPRLRPRPSGAGLQLFPCWPSAPSRFGHPLRRRAADAAVGRPDVAPKLLCIDDPPPPGASQRQEVFNKIQQIKTWANPSLW